MSGRFVRSSKYRHVFGRPTRKEQCYDNIRISKNAWDTNLVKANPRYLSVNWDASGGGAFAVIPIDERGRLPEQLPLFRGHTAVVLDTDWNPFDDSLIASGSDDGKAFIWRVPQGFTLRTEEGADPTDIAPIRKLAGHSRKVGHVLFNPAAENILVTSSGDYTAKVWDVEASSPRLTLKHADIVQSLSWSANGSLLVTTSRDKKLRLWDVRQERPAHVGSGHAGAKNSRVTWMGEHDRFATTGFSKMSDRQLGLWDVRAPAEPVDGFEMLDSISGVCMPFWDDGTQCLYLAGKGDGNIRYFEYQNDKFEFLSEYKSGDPQRGIAFLPKRGVNIHENEVMRAFKTVNDCYIEPISFIVPRRAEVFQDDIFPPAVGSKPAMSASEWFNGKVALPPKIDLASVYAGEEAKEITSDYQPSSANTAESTLSPSLSSKAVDKENDQPSVSAVKTPPPSMNQQTASIKTLAQKFNDNEEGDEEDASSFEEISKPLERSSPQNSFPVVSSTQVSNQPATIEHSDDTFPANKGKPGDIDSTDHISAAQGGTKEVVGQHEEPNKVTTENAGTGQNKLEGSEVKQSLTEIRSLLEEQRRMMNTQNETIGRLTAEVDLLRSKMNEQ